VIPDSSVGIVTSCELGVGVRNLSLLQSVQIDTGAHWVSYATSTGGYFLGGKAAQPSAEFMNAIPLQAWTGLQGSRRLRLPDF
jgi:hypothetical protein